MRPYETRPEAAPYADELGLWLDYAREAQGLVPVKHHERCTSTYRGGLCDVLVDLTHRVVIGLATFDDHYVQAQARRLAEIYAELVTDMDDQLRPDSDFDDEDDE